VLTSPPPLPPTPPILPLPTPTATPLLYLRVGSNRFVFSEQDDVPPTPMEPIPLYRTFGIRSSIDSPIVRAYARSATFGVEPMNLLYSG